MFDFNPLFSILHNDKAVITRYENAEQDAFGDPLTEDPSTGDPIEPITIYNGDANLQYGTSEIIRVNKDSYDAVVFLDSIPSNLKSRDTIQITDNERNTNVEGVIDEISVTDNAVTININSITE